MDKLELIRRCIEDENLTDRTKLVVIEQIVSPVVPTPDELQWAMTICDVYAKQGGRACEP